MGRTKKVGIAGKYGVRYGRTIRERIISASKTHKKKQNCPSCLKDRLKREAAGIWKCEKCGIKFAGKAYKP
jgi:large subunit ribosomal protein L37Ae